MAKYDDMSEIEEIPMDLGPMEEDSEDIRDFMRDQGIPGPGSKNQGVMGAAENTEMAGMGKVMKMFETPYGFDRDGFEENYIQFMDYKDGGGELGLYDFTLQGMGMVKKDTPSDRSMAMGGGMMRMGYAGGTEDIVEPSESMKKDTTTYPLGQDPQFDDKLIYRPDPKDSKELKRLKELMERRKKEKKKLAVGGIAGVL